MSFEFPATPTFTGFNEPRRVEARIDNLIVSGEIPAEIQGTCYRNGPDPRLPPLLGDDVNWNGDGLITMWRFDHGRVDFRSAYVRTEKFRLERAARRALFGAYRNPYTDDPSVAGRDRTTANTAVYLHGGRLLATKEDGLPYQIDPHTLRTIGRHDFDGAMKSQTMTAHPKPDPTTGELLAIGAEARGAGTVDAAIQRIDPDGVLVSEDFLELPRVAFIHDWGVTAEHYIIPIASTMTTPEWLETAERFRWVHDPEAETLFGIVRRDAPLSTIRWFRGPASGGGGHYMNAWTEGDTVYLEGFFSERCQFPYVTNLDGSPFDRELSSPRLARWTFDLASESDGFDLDILFPDDFMEMPVVDPRVQTVQHRYGFAVVLDRSRPLTVQGTLGLGWNTVARVDVETRTLQKWFVGEQTTCQEPIFIPRSNDADEADGWLMTVLTQNTGAELVTEMVILDANDLTAGPIARIHTPFRLHAQTHGVWIDEADLPPNANDED